MLAWARGTTHGGVHGHGKPALKTEHILSKRDGMRMRERALGEYKEGRDERQTVTSGVTILRWE